jgi:hypothetical protein
MGGFPGGAVDVDWKEEPGLEPLDRARRLIYVMKISSTGLMPS